ncbi:MAG: ABC transporter ATP-binding protein [Trebonia sp.]
MTDPAFRSAPAVSLENLSLTLGAFALRGVDFVLDAGEIGVILGPNGSGKSVTLETVAGFHMPKSGRIMIRGRDVTRLPPERRRVGFIFQNFGLFPHLTVAKNVAFGLRARRDIGAGRASACRDDGVQRLLARFGLEPLARRSPADLSPGEKQRVALARGLATHPDVFLFDEPFSALDTRTSDALRAELKRFLRETGIPAIFVTHDHVDALTLADRVAVMKTGMIVQQGPPAQLFNRPASRFVAEFLGVENILPGRANAQPCGRCGVEVSGRLLYAEADDVKIGAARDVLLCVRAEEVRILLADGNASPPSVGGIRLSGVVASLTETGSLVRVDLDCGFPLVAAVMKRTVRELGLRPGLAVEAEIDAAAAHLAAEETP